MRKLVMVLVMLLSFVAVKAGEDSAFYVYNDAGSRLNHFIPSGWMGSSKSLKFTPNWKEDPNSGRTCIRITYDTRLDPDTSWAGIYWQTPANNWGDKRGGYDLSGFSKFKFWAKGEGVLGSIGIGGITGQQEEGDTDNAILENLELTDTWKEYSIDLKGRDLSHIIGGLFFSASAEYNDSNLTLYIDDARYEK